MPVLAIHGVSNRSAEAFATTVRGLEERSGGLAGIVPVFWGDLGPNGPLGAIPGEDDVSELPDLTGVGAFAPAVPSALVDQGAATRDAILAELAERRAAPVAPDTAAAVEAATAEAAAAGWSLALSESVAPLVADVVAAEEAREVGVFGVDLVGAVKGVLRHVQDALTDILVREMREREAGFGGTIARSLGDVLVYDGLGPEIRGRLDAAYRKARDEGPVDIVAHSLGALVAVEWLLGAPTAPSEGAPVPPGQRTVRHLVTFGTQVSLFAELQGLMGPDGTHGSAPGPRTLALDIASWTNVWQELDPLAFVMGRVLRVESPAGPVAVTDHRLTQEGLPTDLGFHSSYWHDVRFATWLAHHLGG